MIDAARPLWIMVTREGRVLGSMLGHGVFPHRDVLRESPGAVIAWQYQDDPHMHVVACSPGARVEWLSTVDVDLGGGSMVRVGPTIAQAEAPVRLWTSPRADADVMADGPVELAITGRDRIRAALETLASRASAMAGG